MNHFLTQADKLCLHHSFRPFSPKIVKDVFSTNYQNYNTLVTLFSFLKHTTAEINFHGETLNLWQFYNLNRKITVI